MKTIAAVLVETGKPLEIAELEIPILKPGQVLVEILYSGICHTQLLEWRGYRGEDKFLPHCLGHEGIGIVREVGPEVKKVKPEQTVILSWIKGLGADVPGSVYRWGERSVNAGAITTFSRYAVISENRLTPLMEGLDLKVAALLGCAMPTGAGAVFNTARVKAGQSVAVFGAGGVGLFSVAAAAASGAAPLVAIDLMDEKLAAARRMGATHVINAGQGDVLAALKEICPQGMDVSIEVTGRPAVMAQAIESLRQQGGKTVVIGNARYGEKLELDPKQLNMGKQVLGTWGGDSRPDEDYPRYSRLLQYGRIDAAFLTEAVYPLTAVNRALDDLASGKVIRPLLDMKLE
jgi:S-(hydroxymethyl)glutathione dehydrogenase/alcohol dehydrogenase